MTTPSPNRRPHCTAARAVAIAAVSLSTLWASDETSPAAGASVPAEGREAEFVNSVAPIFESRCVTCHGAKRQKAGLRLDSPAGIARGGDSGPVLLAGKPAESEILSRVRAEGKKRMPPKGDPLEAAQIATLERWILRGAALPAVTASETIESDHWSLQPLSDPPVPTLAHPRDATLRPPDAFVAAKLAEQGIAPMPRADRGTLLRRVSFDLVGLPPTREEIDSFLSDESPDAWERVVDRLLALPRHGERWGRHWLDVARYTESQGFEYDRLRDRAWHFRDWVIASLNEDLPYDTFVRQQIAGDVLEPITSDSIVATSFLVCGPWDQAGNSQRNQTQRKITREEELEGLVSVVTQSFLGLTVNCARCHSHKFDPIPQEDYYRVKAVFEGVVHGESEIVTPRERQARSDEAARRKAEISRDREALAELLVSARERALATRRELGERREPRAGPRPLAAWSFEGGEVRDSIGALDGKLVAGAKLDRGALVTNGKSAYFESAPLTKDLGEKTLEARLRLPTLDQGGGGVISVQTANGSVFDAIVFAEREAKKWMAGSEGYARTRNLEAPAEDAPPDALVHVACVYSSDGSIQLYRNGTPYGKPYRPSESPTKFRAGDARVVLGIRHSGGGRAFLNAEIVSAALHDRALSAEEVRAAFESDGSSFLTREDIEAALTDAERESRARLETRLARLEKEAKRRPSSAVSYVGKRRQPAPTRLLRQGNVSQPADEVAPGGLRATERLLPRLELAVDEPEAARRGRFADWVVDPRNALVSRVIVNRVWHYHFGRGLAATPNDLGASGESPTHPELIDWLASRLVEDGWSLKALHRRILLSETYQRSARYDPKAAAVDAESRLLWRFAPRRLEAEVLRDTLLAVSGQLDTAMGGPSFRPFKTSSFGSTFFEILNDDNAKFRRRTIYRMNVNSGKDPFLDVFDCPDPSVKTPRRAETTTPLQALSLMNNALVLRTARTLAERLEEEAGKDLDTSVEKAFWALFARAPTPRERTRCVQLAREHGLESVAWALLNTSELLHVR